MARRRRIDAPGMFHHVMNRGVEGRRIFERPDDYRYFQLLLACSVRSSRVRVHGFCLMSNHFHLLLESLDGRVGETMRRIQALYAGRFNRTRADRRPGHLFGARFQSFPIQDQAYLFTAVGYIDLNPVKAGLCRAPWEYPHASARALLLGQRLPWVCPETLHRILAPLRARGLSPVAAHDLLYSGSPALDAMDVVAACLHGPPSAGRIGLDALLGGGHSNRRAWLERQARRGVGDRVTTAVADVRSIRYAVRARRVQAPDAPLDGSSTRSLWDVLEVGLLRDLGGLGFRAIGGLVAMSTSGAATRYEGHRSAMGDANYANVAALTAAVALERCWGPNAAAIARGAAGRQLSQEEEGSS